jgi:hypothetical protein
MTLEEIVFLPGTCDDACVVSQPGWRRLLGRPAIRRVLASASVAGGLGLVFFLVLYIGSRSHITAGMTCGGGEWGCLGLAIIGLLASMLAIVVLAWPLLHAAGVRPAWPVAVVGPVVALAVSDEYTNLTDQTLITGLWIILALSYASAAVITAPRLYRYWSLVVGIAVIALYAATRSAGGL